MQVIIDEREGTCTWVPETPDETGYWYSITTLVPPGKRVLFYGVTPDGALRFRAANVPMELRGTTSSGRRNVEKIRQICRKDDGATGGLTVVGRIDGKRAVTLTGAYCANCGKGMIDVESCKARMCARCRARVPAPTH